MFTHHNLDLPVLSFKQSSLLDHLIHTPALLSSISMGSNNGGTRQPSAQSTTTVAEALEIARESEEGARDPTVSSLLETAVTAIWSKIEAQPTSYVMTRDEFAVFNYFQHRFEGLPLASAARKRYWDHLDITNGN